MLLICVVGTRELGCNECGVSRAELYVGGWAVPAHVGVAEQLRAAAGVVGALEAALRISA